MICFYINRYFESIVCINHFNYILCKITCIFFSALIDLTDVTIPEDVVFKIDAITKVLGFNATVATISKKAHAMMSGIFHSSSLQFRIRKNFRKCSSNLSFLKSRKAQTQQVKY